jgi:hypothetical protein
MSVHGTKPTFSGYQDQVCLPAHCRRSGHNFGYRSDQSQWIKLIHGLVQDHGPVGRKRPVNSV